MVESRPLILQLADSLTGRKAALRIDPSDGPLSLRQLLDKYVRNCPADRLLRAGAITPDSLRTLQALQDLIYRCDDRGCLSDMFAGIAFRQQERPVNLAAAPVIRSARAGDAEVSLIDLLIDRVNVGYHRNWTGFHRRRWNNSPDFFADFVYSTLQAAYGAAGAEDALRLDSGERQLRFLDALGRRVWRSDFENYSRFTGDKLIFKTGDETVRNIAAGSGGICTEKVQALKFLTDHHGLVSEYLIAGDQARDPAPVGRLRELLTTFDFRFSKRYMRYWQHAALLYWVDGAPVLVDATNGNIPYLLLPGAEAERLLAYSDKPAIPVRMVEAEESYYYHRVPQDIPENLFFALEGWISDTDMVQVFENELGLYLSDAFYVTPLPYHSEREYLRLRREYQNICRRAGFAGHVSREWTLDFPLGRQLTAARPAVARKVLASRDHLLQRYNTWARPGHDAGLVVIRLNCDSRNRSQSRSQNREAQ